jgi:hypothetical protein
VPTYEPSKTPNAEEWLALDESEQITLVQEFHRREGIQLPNPGAHAVVHVIIESQLAEGFSAATATLARLKSEGLDRHEAVHAMGSVLMEHARNLMSGSRSAGDSEELYVNALKELTAESWRSSG